MEETRVLEKALQSCQTLQHYIYDSIKLVRRLNIRYNSEWLLKNYRNYMNNIWLQYRCHSPDPDPDRDRDPEPDHGRGSPPHRQRSLPLLPRSAALPAVAVAKAKKSQSLLLIGARSSHELSGSSRRINYRFIKIKRSMEALIFHIQRAIEIGNRQRNYVHASVGGRDFRTRICCH